MNSGKNITPNRFTRRDFIILIMILGVAAGLRFAQLDVSQYRFDEAQLIKLAQNWIVGQHFPTEGLPASLGFPLPPTMVFVISVPYFLFSDPLVAASFVILLNLVGIALLWLIAQRYISRTAAFVATLSYACSPWAIQFSREIWPPDFNISFVIAAILCGLIGFVEGRRWAQVLCLPLLFIAIEIHPNAVVLLPAFLWFLWRKPVRRAAFALSIVIALATLTPYLLSFTSARIDAFRAAIRSNHVIPALDQDNASTLLINYASGAGIETAFAVHNNVYTGQVPLIFWIISSIPVVIGLFSVRSYQLAPLLLLWALTGWLTLTLLPVTLYPYYLAPSIPALCLLVGVGLSSIARLRNMLLIGWVAVLTIQCLLWTNFLNYVRVTKTPDYGSLLTNLLPIRTQLTQSADVLLVGGITGNSGYDIWSTLLFHRTTCVRELIIAQGGITVFPAHPFAILRAPGIDAPETPYLTSDSTRFPLRSGEGAYSIDQFAHAPKWSGPALTPTASTHFDNGVRLNGYALSGQKLYLDWTLPGQSTQDYQYYAHVLNANGDKLAQHDASFWPGKYWCANDRIVTWIDLSPPANAATLQIGMYRLDHGAITGDNVINDAGVASPWVDIPLTTSAGA